MDLNEVISLAKKNRKEANNQKKIGYSTEPKGAKKLQRNVDPSAVQAFLRKKKNEQMKQLEEAMKKKESLQKLRVEVKHTKKANAMAKRTKDNLQVYKGEDYLGLHKEVKRKEEYPLSDEDEMRHKAFMDKLYQKTNRNGFERGSGSRHDSSLPPSEEEKRKRRKQEKNRERARMAAAGLDFNSLLNLAGKQKKAESDEESDESSISTG
uniref:SPT2 homolog N-terminal domain-containing protein n=1 Tax=Ciona savignyi TaxID=51511 RepID=H2Z570_CIOSA